MEGNQLFDTDLKNHVFKRQAEEKLDDLIAEESENLEFIAEILDENQEVEEKDENQSRGWKNGKKKNKDKKNKNKKKNKIEEIIEVEEDDIEEYDDDYEKDEEMVVEEEEKESAPVLAPFTNGLQFSAYSSESRPVYSPAEERIEPEENMFLQYGLDLEGKPQFMDKEVINMLLQNPQAKRVNIIFSTPTF